MSLLSRLTTFRTLEKNFLGALNREFDNLVNGGNGINSSVTALASTLASGWYSTPGETWSYAGSSFTFTVPGDLTSVYQLGARVRFTQTTVKYGVIRDSQFSAGTTTVYLISNDNYSVVNAAITANAYSYAATPQGFPGWFLFDGDFKNGAGGADAFVSTVYFQSSRWHVVGRMIDIIHTYGFLVVSQPGTAGYYFSVRSPVAADPVKYSTTANPASDIGYFLLNQGLTGWPGQMQVDFNDTTRSRFNIVNGGGTGILYIFNNTGFQPTIGNGDLLSVNMRYAFV